MSYVDFYLLPLPQDKMDAYRALAEKAAAVWKEHGALDYKECVIDDDRIEGMASFSDAAGVSAGEKVVAAYILFDSRQHRDEVNAKVMQDPRIKASCDPQRMPFEMNRMAFGGFRTIVES